jgi:hypothetical protein
VPTRLTHTLRTVRQAVGHLPDAAGVDPIHDWLDRPVGIMRLTVSQVPARPSKRPESLADPNPVGFFFCAPNMGAFL